VADYIQDHTSGTSGSGTSVTVTLAGNVPAGNLLAVWVGFDNLTASTPTVSSLDKPGGESATWARVAQHNSSIATAAAGVRGEMWVIRVTQQWDSGTVVTATLSASPPKSCATCREFTGVFATLRGTAGTNTSTGGTPSAATSGTALVAGDLVLGGATFETSTTPSDDADTTNGSWSAGLIGSATGGASAAQVRSIQQYKVVSATGVQTYNPTANSDSGAAVVALQNDPAATGTLAATLDDATLAASGAETISGTLAATLEDASLAAAGTVTSSGPGHIGLVCSGAITALGTVLNMTTVQTVPVGTLLVGRLACDSADSVNPTLTVTDTRSNTWSNSDGPGAVSGVTVAERIFSCSVTTQIESGDTITVTLSTNRIRVPTRVDGFSGMATTSVLDKTNQATGVSATPSPGATGTLSQADELIYVSFGAGLRTFTPGTGYTNTGTVATAVGSSDRQSDAEFKFVTATTSQTPDASYSTSVTWAASVATYKVAAAGGGNTGTLATTLAGATLAASGAETFTGTLASTLAGASLAASGAETVAGTFAATLAGATLAASGTVTSSGVSGSLATTLAGATLAASGTETFTGALASTFAGVTLAGSGAVTNPITGTLAATLSGATLAGSGTERFTGTLTTMLTGATLVAAGGAATPVTGTLASTLGGATLAASGVETITGTLATTLTGATLAASGSGHLIFGALASALSSVTLAAAGSEAFTGTLTTVLAGASLSADGTNTPPAITYRPNTGTTSRPGSGTTGRPFAGVTPRP
jgi:hypothetical protein